MATKEDIAAKRHAYYLKRREEAAEKQRIYRAAHREQVAANQRAYRAAHREEFNANQRVYVEAHREQYREHQRAYEERNREARISRLRDPERRNAFFRARRARELENGGTHTAAEWRALCDWFGNACVRCGATGKLSRDHVVPVTKGGTNSIDNIQPLCASCNHRKHVQADDYRDPVRLAAFLEQL